MSAKKTKKPTAAATEKLEADINALQVERDDLFEKLQRVSADYANFQKRAPKQITDGIGYEKEKIIKTMLPAFDNLEHTLHSADSAENLEVLIKGIRIIYDQMTDILKSHGVEQIKALGEKFDPALHQAMMQRADADSEDGVILEEFQKGYQLNGRVVRPSNVVVNKLPAKPTEPDESIENAEPEQNDQAETAEQQGEDAE